MSKSKRPNFTVDDAMSLAAESGYELSAGNHDESNRLWNAHKEAMISLGKWNEIHSTAVRAKHYYQYSKLAAA